MLCGASTAVWQKSCCVCAQRSSSQGIAAFEGFRHRCKGHIKHCYRQMARCSAYFNFKFFKAQMDLSVLWKGHSKLPWTKQLAKHMLNCEVQFLMKHLLHLPNCPTGLRSEFPAIKIKQAVIFETEIMDLESMLKYTNHRKKWHYFLLFESI